MGAELEKLKVLKSNYIRTFSSDEGKQVLADLESKCYIKDTTFSRDPHLTAFNEGQRSVVLSIKSMMDLDVAKLKEIQSAGD